jgi:hypothetical protein
MLLPVGCHHDALQCQDAVIEKLRLKNTALKTNLKKLQSQLQQKVRGLYHITGGRPNRSLLSCVVPDVGWNRRGALSQQDSGDVLHYIDFHQLQIENKQLAAKVEERNDELLKLKVTTGRTLQILNQLKVQPVCVRVCSKPVLMRARVQSELSEATKRLTEAKSGIAQRTEMLGKLQSTSVAVTGDISRFKQTAGTLRLEVEDTSDMPSVMDYLQLKAHELELVKTAQNWKRKLEIAELAAARKTTTLSGSMSSAK